MNNCELGDRKLEGLCEGMKYAMRGNAINDHKRGFTLIELTDIKTGEARLSGIKYRHFDEGQGIMLNFCPFCGASLQTQTHKKAVNK